MVKKKKWVCLLCGSKKRLVLYKKKRLPKSKISPTEVLCTGEIGARGAYDTIWKCASCGIVLQDLSFTANELEEAYSGGADERYFEQLPQRINLFKASLDRIENYTRSRGNLLDVGANAGIFLSVATKRKWKATGIDPSVWAGKAAKKKFGVTVKKAVFEDFKAKPATYDLITMWDVLEHYINPVAALKKAHKLLKKDGLIALTTIDINSWFSKLLGSHWTWLIRIHLWYFTHATLKKMVEKAGFKVEWIGGQVRWFSLPYLLSRFTGWNFSWLPEVYLPAPTGDIVFIIARKK